jgi:hypothetical protein
MKHQLSIQTLAARTAASPVPAELARPPQATAGRPEVPRWARPFLGKIRYVPQGTASTCVINPCTDTNGANANINRNITIYLKMPFDATMTTEEQGPYSIGKVLAYYPIDVTHGVLASGAGGGSAIILGHPTADYTTGATFYIDPCDSAGTDLPTMDNLTVQAGFTLPEGSNIPMSAIVPVQLALNGNYYVLGQPTNVLVDVTVVDASRKFQKKLVADFGLFKSTPSNWIDWYTNGQGCET